MNEWSLKIKRVQNGFIISKLEEDKDGNYYDQESVIEFTPDANSNCDDAGLTATKNLLWEIRDYFHLRYNKHADKNVDIVIVNENGEILDD